MELVRTEKINQFIDIGKQPLHLRATTQKILESEGKLSYLDDPPSLPIAGLRTFEHQGLTITPQEILSSDYRPLLVLDLDESIWPHVEFVIKSVSEASGVPASMEDLKKSGYSTKIPQWKDNSRVMATHDQIVGGNHPIYFPYVNKAFPEAVKVIKANAQMGHQYCYLTGRPAGLFTTTLRTLEWNDLPHDHRALPVDARTHSLPLPGYLYCSQVGLSKINDYKKEVTTQWINNLKKSDWKGKLIIIDDLLKPFRQLIESDEIIGISLQGYHNLNMLPYQGEIRFTSWVDIGQSLMEIHQQAIKSDPIPWRIFDCSPILSKKLLIVSKKEAGSGQFPLDEINSVLVSRQQWQQNQKAVLSQLNINWKN